MQVRKLAVEGALEFTGMSVPDERGTVTVPFHEEDFAAATGHRLFTVAQTMHSESRRGVVRGVHYTATPPGTAKYVYSLRGRSLDIVLDLRVGSPTFGCWDAVVLDEGAPRALYFPTGLGHAFIALEDHAVMCYLMSSTYVAERERAISVFDPRLRLPIPSDITQILSERDRRAPTLAQALAQGELPDYRTCLAIDGAPPDAAGGPRPRGHRVSD